MSKIELVCKLPLSIIRTINLQVRMDPGESGKLLEILAGTRDFVIGLS